MNTMSKKAQGGGLVTGLVFGIASLVIGVIVALVLVQTLTGAGLIDQTANPTEYHAVNNLSSNFTEGIGEVSGKLPTILLVAAIVLILGVLAVLVGVWQRMRMGGGQL